MSSDRHPKQQRIVLFGGYGFIGRHLATMLCQQGHKVRLAVARARVLLPAICGHPNIEAFSYSLEDLASIEETLQEVDAIVNLIGILNPREQNSFKQIHEDWPARIVEAAKNVSRKQKRAPHLVHISAMGAAPNAASDYLRSKFAGEEKINAFASYTIIRPGIVYGSDSAFVRRMCRLLRLTPCLLLPTGSTLVQPIMIENLCDLILRVLFEPKRFHGQVLLAAGPEVMSMKTLVARIGRQQLGARRIIVPLGKRLSFATASLLEKLMRNPPLTRDNCLSAYSAKACSPEQNDALKILGSLMSVDEQFQSHKRAQS